MIIPDINLLIYAYHRDSPFHEPAALWWRSLRDSGEAIGVPWAVTLGFVRIMSNPRVLEAPPSPTQALDIVAEWFRHPHISPLNPGPAHLERLREVIAASGGGRNAVADAHIAALALEHDAEVHSNDSDFARFPGVRWRNPLS